VAVAVVLGVVSILAIVAFIDHSAHSMDVSRILSRATSDAVRSIERLWEEAGAEDGPDAAPDPPPDHLVVLQDEDGWIKHIDLEAVTGAVGPRGTVRLDTEVGRYAVAGTPLCTMWPAPDDGEAAREKARDAVVIGRSRTVEQDVGYGVRQLADVALRALSPGINDPTTAQDAAFHMGSVLRELLVRRPPLLVTPMSDGRRLVRPERLGHVELIDLAFDEVRIAADGQPTVCIYLLELLHLLDQVAGEHGATAARDALRRQAALIRAGVDRSELGAHDADRVRSAHDRRFGPP
jgi:uncharacterized membrane protein